MNLARLVQHLWAYYYRHSIYIRVKLLYQLRLIYLWQKNALYATPKLRKKMAN